MFAVVLHVQLVGALLARFVVHAHGAVVVVHDAGLVHFAARHLHFSWKTKRDQPKQTININPKWQRINTVDAANGS